MFFKRRDRAGRIRAGICYQLYPKLVYNAMPQFQLSETLCTPLPQLSLQMKHICFTKIVSLLSKALEPPNPQKIEDVMELLKTIGASNDVQELTSLNKDFLLISIITCIQKNKLNKLKNIEHIVISFIDILI